MLLKAAEKVYGLVAGFVRCLVDRREPGKVRHTVADLLGQRIGWEDSPSRTLT